jgi:diguanylate cyclase (GGDEF)-like protein
MTRPGFRQSGPRRPEGTGASFGTGHVAGSPFTQAQIQHLMKTEFARARRYGYPVACVLVQVDRLLPMSDVHGGVLRDSVRRALGSLVADKVRGTDHLGLVSDDRYLLVLPHTSGEAARIVAERIRTAFDQLEIEAGGHPVRLSLSLGVAACEDQKTLFFDTLLAQAEHALERASAGGGGQVVVFQKGIESRGKS